MPHIDNVVGYMLAQRGKPYWNRDDRRFGQAMFDCSGIHVAAWRACGVWYPAAATWSGAQLRWGMNAGTTIGYAEARRTYGAVAVRGGLGGAGNAGHIVTSLGDGRTMEAMGTAYGCRIGAFDNRGFADFFRVPGVAYRDGAPAQPVPPARPPFNWEAVRAAVRELGRRNMEAIHVDGITVVRASDNVPHVFVRGLDDGLWHTLMADVSGRFRPWENLGGKLSSDPAVVPGDKGALTIVVRGVPKGLWSLHWSGTHWGPWTEMQGEYVDSRVA